MPSVKPTFSAWFAVVATTSPGRCAVFSVRAVIPIRWSRIFSTIVSRFQMVGKPAVMFEGTDVDGKTVRLADYKGKVVLIDFWASWAPPCVAAFPQLRELYHRYRDQGFVVIGVNLDSLGQDLTGKKPDSKEMLSLLRWFLLQSQSRLAEHSW